jgi:hypothetical protein
MRKVVINFHVPNHAIKICRLSAFRALPKPTLASRKDALVNPPSSPWPSQTPLANGRHPCRPLAPPAHPRTPVLHGIPVRQSAPLPRPNETVSTMRARLVYQSRKRGTLESDLILSTFAREHLPGMSQAELREYDKVRLPFGFLFSSHGGKTDADLGYSCSMKPTGTYIIGRRRSARRRNAGRGLRFWKSSRSTRGTRARS